MEDASRPPLSGSDTADVSPASTPGVWGLWLDAAQAEMDGMPAVVSPLYLEFRCLAARCAHELHGYAVDVEAGTEIEVVRARLAQLERCCASYSRALRHMHVRLTKET